MFVKPRFQCWILPWESHAASPQSICGSEPILIRSHLSWLKASQNCRQRLILCTQAHGCNRKRVKEREAGKGAKVGKTGGAEGPLCNAVTCWLAAVRATRQGHSCGVCINFSPFLPICCHNQLDILAVYRSKPRLATTVLRKTVKTSIPPNSSNDGIIFMICSSVLSEVHLLIRKSVFLCFFAFVQSNHGCLILWVVFFLSLPKLKGSYLCLYL